MVAGSRDKPLVLAWYDTRRVPEEAMDFSIRGYVEQIDLQPKKHALLPLFEAVVNSILALGGEAGTRAGRIVVKCERERQASLDAESPGHYGTFVILDDGEGFQDENFNAFGEAYSRYHQHLGCKGVGRFTWLKAFENVHVDSTFSVEGVWWRRKFDFDLSHDGINNASLDQVEQPDQQVANTIVALTDFREPYRSKAPKDVDGIGRGILSHCFTYLHAEAALSVIVQDESGSVFDVIATLRDEVHQTLKVGTIEVGSEISFSCTFSGRYPLDGGGWRCLQLSKPSHPESEPSPKAPVRRHPRESTPAARRAGQGQRSWRAKRANP